MKFKVLDSYSWFVNVIVIGSIFFIWLLNSSDVSMVLGLVGCFSISGSYFVFDVVSFYLSLLSILLLFILLFLYEGVSCRSKFFIVVSIFSSLLCYCSNFFFFFFLFYEVSILSLLLLLVVESPYSERYLAGWYLGGYVVLTSLPMLLCLFYFVCVSGSVYMSDWFVSGLLGGSLSRAIVVLLGVLFITKIPIFPFHSWLPVVHAEATSIVSVCLSGYVMKLGLLGVCRFCWWVVSDSLFFLGYVVVALFFSVLFFLVSSWELDGKRWLAFLSLSHIVICIVCLGVGLYDSSGLVFLYSLGHGLSAGLVFVYLWLGYELCGSRNWVILKSVLGGSLFFRVLLVLCLCTVASLPPVVQFFVEVSLLGVVGVVSLLLSVFFCVYLFLGNLVPLFVVGSMLSRHFCYEYGAGFSLLNYSLCLLLLLFWSFFAFLVF
nr:NADH dehydrogenase subunit 4 [Strigea falconis]